MKRNGLWIVNSIESFEIKEQVHETKWFMNGNSLASYESKKVHETKWVMNRK